MAGYEYQRYEEGAAPMWTRIGFPGQYYDPETDLFENWHRFYDPTTGRYLEPDPVWKFPEMLLPRLAAGHFDPVYAYAGNNPIGAVDPTGLVGDGTNDVQQVRTMADGTAQLEENCESGDATACTVYNAQLATATTIAVASVAVAAVESGAVGAAGEAASAVAKKGKAVVTAAVAAVKKLAKDVTIDGPSKGAKYANGRLIGLRYKKQPVVRLDLHPLAGSDGKPVLHLNIGPGESRHIWIWPREPR